MPFKKVKDMTPEEHEAHKAYMRRKKAESRALKRVPEVDKRTYSDRAEYQREYQRKLYKRTKNKGKPDQE